MARDDLALDQLEQDLPSGALGRSLLFYERIDSTNGLAKQRARAGDAP